MVDYIPTNQSSPLRGAIIAKLALAVSLIFIFTVCFCFIGTDVDEDYFKKVLTKTANTDPGVVLLGESVDVDVDEPSITIRWSILACGEGLFLPGPVAAHGIHSCGLPSQPLRIFVDNDPEPAATYDPTKIPLSRDTGSWRSTQNLVQFDSNHVLDVHEARVYPFDTYLLTSTLRALSDTNETVPIRKLLTIAITSSFDIDTDDSETYSTSTTGAGTVTYASRDIDMRVARPTSARIFALTLFALNWMMAHATVGLVFMCKRLDDVRPIFKHLLSAGAILIAIPQMRNSMPDAPGFDDTIGYFPQMIFAGISTILILIIIIGHELDNLREPPVILNQPTKGHPSPPPAALNRVRPPPTPTKDSSSMEIAQYEMYRAMQHVKGEYVFPPVQLIPSDPSAARSSHRRTKSAMPGIKEGSGDSRFSEFLSSMT
ncbi:hypothetical protein H0H87_009767 [Tephrocybe sp. NHM501043]|nr:hypothetical protein H0H87_009767 [Tephrocybe sp. NHM501043]